MKKNYIFFFYYLKEIKYRITLSFISFFFTFFIIYIYNFEFLYLIILDFSRLFIFTEISEMVQITMKTSLWLSLLLCLPHITYGYFCFISPSLSDDSQKIYFRQLIFINFLTYGQTFIAFITIPLLFHFFSGFEIKSFIYTIAWEIRIDSYFQFLSYYLLSFYLLLVLFYCCYKFLFHSPKNGDYPNWTTGIDRQKSTTNRWLTKKSSHYIFKKKNKKKFLFFFILMGSILSPSDILTQLFITSFFYLSFEIFFFILFIFHKYKQYVYNYRLLPSEAAKPSSFLISKYSS